MAILSTWSSSADGWTFTNGLAPSYVTAGSFGERAVWPATTVAAYGARDITAATSIGTRFIYTLASFAGAGASVLRANGGGVLQYRLDLSTAGFMRIKDAAGATVLPEGTVAFTLNTEHRFEVYRSGTTLTCKMYRVSDNVLRDTVTGTVGGTAVDSLHFGSVFAAGGTLGSFTFDEIVVTNTAAEVGAPVSTVPLTATAVVSPASGTPPYTQTVTVTATGGTGVYSYQMLDWGDGSTTAAQSSNVLTKTITAGTAAGSKSWTARVTG